MGRPDSDLKRSIQAHYHSAEKTPISIRYNLGVKEEKYVHRQGWVGEKDAMTLKEILKEMNRLKSNRSAKSSIYTPHGTLSLASLCHGHTCAPNPCTKPPKRVMRIRDIGNHKPPVLLWLAL